MLYIEIAVSTVNKVNVKLFSKKYCKYKYFFKQFKFFAVVFMYV